MWECTVKQGWGGAQLHPWLLLLFVSVDREIVPLAFGCISIMSHPSWNGQLMCPFNCRYHCKMESDKIV